jgi:hypothetical protein
MIGSADVEKLRAICAPEPAVLSLYLPVSLDPAELRELPARAGDLIASAAANATPASSPLVGDAARPSPA